METSRKTISLNDIEQRLAKFMGFKRYQYCRKVGAKATVYGNRNAKDAEVSQYGAELAFCKIMNIYPDTDFTKFNPQDCILYDGKRIDIKFTEYIDGRLLAKNKNWKNPPDYFVLMVGKFPTYMYAGYMESKDLLRKERLDYSLPFPAYTARQDELKF